MFVIPCIVLFIRSAEVVYHADIIVITLSHYFYYMYFTSCFKDVRRDNCYYQQLRRNVVVIVSPFLLCLFSSMHFFSFFYLLSYQHYNLHPGNPDLPCTPLFLLSTFSSASILTLVILTYHDTFSSHYFVFITNPYPSNPDLRHVLFSSLLSLQH